MSIIFSMTNECDQGKGILFLFVTRSFSRAVRPVGKDVDQNNKTILSRYIHIYNCSSIAH